MSNAFSPETLARQIIVRYRGVGHARFAIPAVLCEQHFAAQIEESLRNLTGVYRVTLYASQGKLSVFYDHHACDLHDVARCLHGVLAGPAAQMQRSAAVTSIAQRLHVTQPLQWIKDKSKNLKATAADWRTKAKLLSQFASAQTQGKSLLQGVLSEKSIINFTNDIVVYYLIKTHWDLVTHKWLKQPLKYRNAWFTIFYLVFLLVRFRKQSAKKS